MTSAQGISKIRRFRNDHSLGYGKQGGKYDDGKIVDPESGKVYSANMKVLEDGKKLEVRGYIGFSLIGRSQTWERVKD